MPKRIQRSRAKGWRLPENALIVDRSSKWGNQFKINEERTRKEAIMAYRIWIESCLTPEQREEYLAPLRGKDLCCWCKISQACHADILLELANR